MTVKRDMNNVFMNKIWTMLARSNILPARHAYDASVLLTYMNTCPIY